MINSFIKLKQYCENEDYRGWDPYDGLNSKIFRALPFKYFRFPRLAWIQLFKRNPLNLRPLMLVPKDYNSKGVGLFLTGYCNLFELAVTGNNQFGTKEEIVNKINELAELLIGLRTKGYSGACWGYNFDWQNRVFFQPRNTPTVVVTSFCADALFNAYEITKNKKYLDTALSSADFIIKDLNRIKYKDNLLFSYSPLDHSRVYNASLLGVRLLARCYRYNKDETHQQLAHKVLRACISSQRDDGSWYYGMAKNQKWIDSFHTGFNLECIWEYMQYTGDYTPQTSFDKGMKFYLENFFLEDGTPKYYHDKIYPVDIHSPAQLIVTLARTGTISSHEMLLKKTINWTIKHMQNPKGYFYYQLKRTVSSKIPYMRWAQAWMFYAFSYYLRSMKSN